PVRYLSQYCDRDLRVPPSFPTRRSSDLIKHMVEYKGIARSACPKLPPGLAWAGTLKTCKPLNTANSPKQIIHIQCRASRLASTTSEVAWVRSRNAQIDTNSMELATNWASEETR